MAEKSKTGWYKIHGGPHNGQEYYPPNEPVADKPVFLGPCGLDGTNRVTRYVWNKTATAVVYGDVTHVAQR